MKINIKSKNWREFCETSDENMTVIFRLAIGVVLLPHCYSEWTNMNSLITSFEANGETMSMLVRGLNYAAILFETISLLMVLLGIFGKISVSILAISIFLHFIPIDGIMLNLFWNQYKVYVLLIPLLLFLAFNGSGRFSLDYRFYKSR